MSPTPHDTLADPQQIITDLRRERDEALAREAATAEVLQVINSSPGDLTPVFEAILEKAHTLCGADHGAMFLRNGETLHAIASRGVPEAFAAHLRQGFLANEAALSKPLLAGEPFVQLNETALAIGRPIHRTMDEISKDRTLLSVPLRKGEALFGMIVAGRFEERPFTESQIALLQNFAAQAVIAIENARLITETREALQQQTATAEVLAVINSSPGDLAPVFDAILEKASGLTEAAFGILRSWDGEHFHFAAAYGNPRLTEWARNRPPIKPEDASPLGRIAAGETPVTEIDRRQAETRCRFETR
jgi:GAF domain-containing protein